MIEKVLGLSRKREGEDDGEGSWEPPALPLSCHHSLVCKVLGDSVAPEDTAAIDWSPRGP